MATSKRDRGGLGDVSPARITIWLFVGAMGLFLLISGIVGIIAKG